jgi:hypothetical protein
MMYFSTHTPFSTFSLQFSTFFSDTFNFFPDPLIFKDFKAHHYQCCVKMESASHKADEGWLEIFKKIGGLRTKFNKFRGSGKNVESGGEEKFISF